MATARTERDAARLLGKIRRAGAPVPEGARFEATHASQSMRVEGGAVWILVDAEGRPAQPLVCSQWPRRYLVTREISAYPDRLGEWHVDPASLT